MTWMGPTYGMWADSVDSMKEFAQAARENKESAEQWREYAKNLEAALNEVGNKFLRTKDMYIEAAGREKAQAVLKEAALKEIERLDPSNKLLDPTFRKTIFDREKEELVKELKQER
ncbi:hypothetical protein [Noviherbaspirillum pedocola]|uniref:Uncharacterized protein n=1 Tax=Noviherbaspirillum pedocola TaxID=2801341 RepID=A0A934W9Y9_9BURK|nr:hypothetical protein [Noviherbaspirillum pedocola]MBK4738898.1 hypothetical protein [Noviherbaspirillum pedocola]